MSRGDAGGRFALSEEGAARVSLETAGGQDEHDERDSWGTSCDGTCSQPKSEHRVSRNHILFILSATRN